MAADVLFLTPKEVAEILGVHQKTVHQWLRTGKLSGTKISYRAWRIPKSALEAFVARNSNSHQSHKDTKTNNPTVQSATPDSSNTSSTGDSCSKMKYYIRDIMGEENTTGSPRQDN